MNAPRSARKLVTTVQIIVYLAIAGLAVPAFAFGEALARRTQSKGALATSVMQAPAAGIADFMAAVH